MDEALEPFGALAEAGLVVAEREGPVEVVEVDEEIHEERLAVTRVQLVLSCEEKGF